MPHHVIRDPKTGKDKKVSLTPMKAIRYFCLECMMGSSDSIKACPSTKCPLYLYRTGKTGYSKSYTDNQIEEFKRNLAKARENKKK